MIGGPPQNTFMLRRSMSPGPEPLRSNTHPYGGWPGQSEGDLNKVNRHTGLFVKMIYLHALATAGRCKRPADSSDIKEVGFLLEQPRDPRGYLLFSDPLTQDSVSFWRTSLWEGYEAEAGLTTYTFDMSSLGKALKRHTTKSFSLCSGRFRWTWGSPKQGGQCVRPKKNVVHGMVNPFGSKRNSKNTKIQITAQMCQWTDNRCKAVCLPTKKEISMKASIYNWISRRWCKEGHSTGFGLFGVA